MCLVQNSWHKDFEAGMHQTPNSSSILFLFRFFLLSHIQHRALVSSLQSVCEHPALWQTFKHTVRTYSTFTIGGHSTFTFSKRLGHYCKWSPLALALWRKWPCLDNRLSERDTEWEMGGGAVCTAIMCVYEKLWTIEELEENSEEHKGPAVCICYCSFVPLKRKKGYKATSIRWNLSLTR